MPWCAHRARLHRMPLHELTRVATMTTSGQMVTASLDLRALASDAVMEARSDAARDPMPRPQVLVADVDEIANPEMLNMLLACDP